MEWQIKKLGDVAKIQNGFAFKSSKYSDSGFFVMRITNVQDGRIELNNPRYIKNPDKNFVLNKGNILISLTGNVGRVGVIEKEHLPAVLNQRVARIKVINSDELDSDYLFNFLRSEVFISEVIRGGHGMAQQNVSTKDIENIQIPVLPINEQKRIVARLDALLGKIMKAKQLRAKAQEVTKNLLSAELHKIFEQGKSKGWEEKELIEICELNPKKSEIKDKKDDMVVSFVPMSAINEYSQKIVFFDERQLGEVKKGYTYFKDDDILFAKITPCMENGKIAIAKNLKNGIGFGTTEFHVIRAKKEIIPEWIYYILRQPFFRDIAKQKMTGSAGQKRVPIKFLENYKILVPGVGEQKRIVARLDALSEKIKKMQEYQNQTQADLIALEKSILHQAFANKT